MSFEFDMDSLAHKLKQQETHAPARPAKPAEKHSDNEALNSAEVEGAKPEYRDTKVLDPPRGGTAPKRKSKGKKYVQLRQVPLDIITIAQKEFPTASSRATALSAYIIVRSGSSVENLNIDDEVKDLVRAYSGDKQMSNLTERLDRIEKTLQTLLFTIRTVEVGIGYNLFDRLGYRQEPLGKSPKDLMLAEDGMIEMLERLRAQSMALRREEQVRTGRPIR